MSVGGLMNTNTVEFELRFTLDELSQVCCADQAQLRELVDEGVLTPMGAASQDWRFDAQSLQRARAALRLLQDLELNAAGVALALDLLDEIGSLRAQLQRSQR